MKTLLTFLLLAAAISVAAQTSLPPGMAYVPHTLLNYDYWRDQEKKIRISDHYAAQYVESNFQYQWYLRCLKAWGQDSLFELAQPDPAVWEVKGLTEVQQAYLKENYWTAAEFEHYPVVGLDFEQVRLYLWWKTDMLNLAAYEAAGGKQDYVKGEFAASAEGFPKQFNMAEYNYQTNDSTRIFQPFANFRLPTAQELFSELPIPKKTKGEAPAPEHSLLAWLKTQPKFAFLQYEPPTENEKNSVLKSALETLGIRPVAASDLDKMAKRKDDANLPLLCMEQQWPAIYYKNGFVLACSEEDLEMRRDDPNFNPKHLQVLVFDPKKVGTVAWVSKKSKLLTLSIADLDERPLCGFRAMMTKPD
ncbi:MAG: hypothetical protein GC192_03620 [Bacteroidetes bacterium]|nr:hypothetical protein [Bacteroidota bacterium]